MKKHLALIATFLIIGSAVINAQESMEELIDRVFNLAKSQLVILDTQTGDADAPRTLSPEGNLVTSKIDWWCSGFFPGSLWLTYENTGDPRIKALAEKRTLQLAPVLNMHTTHDIGFMINCSYGNALRITGDTAAYRSTVLRAADTLAARFVPKAGVTRSWDGDWTVRHGWDIPVIIDNMMNLELLMNAFRLNGKEQLRKVATTHANTTMAHHFRPDYGTYHVVDYSSVDGSVRTRQTHQGHSDESTWARGEAWALYGFTMMYVKTGDEEYFKLADYISKFIIRNLPEEGIPYWDFSRVGDLRDASAAAVMASAFVQLYEITGRRHFLDIADKQIRALAGDGYLSAPGANHGFLLMHSVGNMPGKSEIDVPLTYADYYFLEALSRRKRATAHPRLLLDGKTWDSLCTQLNDGSNKPVRLMHDIIMKEAGQLPADHIIWELDESGKRILPKARAGFRRVLFDSYAYRYTSDRRYLEHAERTLNELCDMPDWNGWHFLDVAEMSAALAIGYDWLYNDLSPELKRRMIKTINEYAFMEAFDFNKAWFYDRTHNWNQVCNGGLAMAGLAFREDCGAVAGNVVRNAVRSNRRVLDKIYGPDGCYPEGPSYWGYGNIFQMLLNGSLDSAIGDDFGLSGAKGYDRTGDFVTNCYAADHKVFNYYDNSLKEAPSIALWYLAWRFDKPWYLDREVRFLEDKCYTDNTYLPVVIGYASRMDAGHASQAAHGMYVGHGNNPIVTVRGTDAEGEWFLGVKGGKAGNNHGHVDAGSFVFDHAGVRWAADPGSVSYTKVENELKAKGGDFWSRSQKSLRWTVYPIANEWHNTLTVNGKCHIVDSLAKITATVDEPDFKSVKIDFGGVLGDDIVSADRTVGLRGGSELTIVDRIKAAKDSRICFTLVSEAKPETDGKTLTLRSGDKKMAVTTSGAKAAISIVDSQEAAESGLSVIRIEYCVKPGRTCTFTVKMN